MKRQPRAKIGQGGLAPSLGDKDPRNRRSQQPQVAESQRVRKALLRLGEVTESTSDADVRAALQAVISVLLGRT